MTDASAPITRRKLLAGLAGAGAVSAGAGGATKAVLSDELELSGRSRAGTAGIDVDCDSCTTGENTGVDFEVDGLEPGPGSEGEKQLRLTVGDDPVRVWVRTTCPPAVDGLGDALDVRLTLERDGEGVATENVTQLFPHLGTDSDGSLTELRRALADGRELTGRDGECLESGAERRLRLEYSLSENSMAGTTANEETKLDLEFHARQCRHVSGDEVENTFADRDCSPSGRGAGERREGGPSGNDGTAAIDRRSRRADGAIRGGASR